MPQFQFKKPITEVLSNVLLRTFLGIDKVLIINEEENHENFILYEANRNNDKAHFVKEFEINRNDYPKKKHFYNWISLNNTPFASDKGIRTNNGIFGEYENRILHLFLPPDDGDFMIFYIFFNQSNPLDGPNAINKLSTDYKQYAAHTIYNLLKEVRNNHLQDLKIASLLHKMYKRISNSNNQNLYFIEAFVTEYLTKASIQYNVKFEITNDALNHLYTTYLTPTQLTQLLDDSIVWLINFSTTNQTKFIIERIHLVDETITFNNEQKHPNKLHEEKYNRSFEFLDRLENAALKLINTGQKVTGSNIGKACEDSISHPGIIDFLRRNAKKIRTLSRIYPTSWPIIRNQFSSIQNILEDNNASSSSIGA